MEREPNRLPLYIPGYRQNAVIQLIFFCGVTYILLAISWAIIMIINGNEGLFASTFLPNVALGDATAIASHWWTFLTYGWFQLPNNPLELLSNMLWLYCFGSVVQGLIGYKQIIPLFVYCLFTGGLVYMAARLAIPALPAPTMLIGSKAGLMGMAVASVALTPQYRFYLTETFSIPLLLVAGIFAILQIIGSSLSLPVLLLVIAGGLTGLGYISMLKAGYRPGDWMYGFVEKLEQSVTPPASRQLQAATARKGKRPANRSNRMQIERVPETQIDEILDKINQKGYNSLTKEEKEMLLRAGKQ